MAFSFTAVREGLATVVKPIVKGELYPYADDNPVTPCVIVFPGDGDYHLAMQKGSMRVPMQLAILENSVVTDEAQASLDAYLSSGTGQDRSLIDALQHSQLGGACLDLHVLGWEAYGAVEMGDERRFFGVVLNIAVYCDRK